MLSTKDRVVAHRDEHRPESLMSAPLVPVLRVDDLDTARRFYVHTLGCRVVETTPAELSLELHGLPLRLRAGAAAVSGEITAGAAFLLGVDDWCTVSERLREHAVDVAVETARRFSIVPGEQCAMHLSDPDGNIVTLLGFAREADQLAA